MTQIPDSFPGNNSNGFSMFSSENDPFGFGVTVASPLTRRAFANWFAQIKFASLYSPMHCTSITLDSAALDEYVGGWAYCNGDATAFKIDLQKEDAAAVQRFAHALYDPANYPLTITTTTVNHRVIEQTSMLTHETRERNGISVRVWICPKPGVFVRLSPDQARACCTITAPDGVLDFVER